MMKRFLLALALLCLTATGAQAQCSLTNVIVTPFGPVFEEFPSTFVTGGETWIGYEVQNENPLGCADVSVSAGAFVRGGPGRPTPPCITTEPLPGTYTFLLAPKSGVLFLSHFATLDANSTCGSDYFGATPAFDYTMRTNFQLNGVGFQLNFDEPIRVLDLWGNHCAPPEPSPTPVPTAQRTPSVCSIYDTTTSWCVACAELGEVGHCGSGPGCCWSAAK